MSIPTERGISRMIYPVVEKSKGKKELPLVINFNESGSKCTELFRMNSKEKSYFIVDNNWDHRSFMAMDIITSQLCKALFGEYTPLRNIESQAFRKSKKEIDDILKNGDYQYVIVNRSEFRQIPYFNKISNERIFSILEKMANTHFTGYYGYRYFNLEINRFKHEKKFVENDKLIDKVEKEGKNSFKIYLGSNLAKLYILNVAQMNIDFINESIFDLNKYCQLLYRYIRSIKTDKSEVKLSFRNVLNKINIHNGNPSRDLHLLRKYLTELENNQFIKGYEINPVSEHTKYKKGVDYNNLTVTIKL